MSGQGTSACADRAVAADAAEPDVSALRASIPSAADAALELIFLTNWAWEGAGSPVRNSLGAGSTAREVLGLEPLPNGWPSEAEYLRRATLAKIVTQAIEARKDATTNLGESA